MKIVGESSYELAPKRKEDCLVGEVIEAFRSYTIIGHIPGETTSMWHQRSKPRQDLVKLSDKRTGRRQRLFVLHCVLFVPIFSFSQ
jgi:hypothetical protein